MVASELTEVIWAVFAFLVVVGIGWLIISKKIDGVRFKAGPMEANIDMHKVHEELKKLSTTMEAVNDAVNHRQGDEPTLVERVKKIESHAEWERAVFQWQNECLLLIANYVGLKLPMQPKEEREPSESQ